VTGGESQATIPLPLGQDYQFSVVATISQAAALPRAGAID
jgi:hypothetical protein